MEVFTPFLEMIPTDLDLELSVHPANSWWVPVHVDLITEIGRNIYIFDRSVASP